MSLRARFGYSLTPQSIRERGELALYAANAKRLLRAAKGGTLPTQETRQTEVLSSLSTAAAPRDVDLTDPRVYL